VDGLKLKRRSILSIANSSKEVAEPQYSQQEFAPDVPARSHSVVVGRHWGSRKL